MVEEMSSCTTSIGCKIPQNKYLTYISLMLLFKVDYIRNHMPV